MRTINGITSMSLIYLGILICKIIQSGSLFGYRNCEYVVLKIVIINIRSIQYVAETSINVSMKRMVILFLAE